MLQAVSHPLVSASRHHIATWVCVAPSPFSGTWMAVITRVHLMSPKKARRSETVRDEALSVLYLSISFPAKSGGVLLSSPLGTYMVLTSHHLDQRQKT